jgi:hypothetical protein
MFLVEDCRSLSGFGGSVVGAKPTLVNRNLSVYYLHRRPSEVHSGRPRTAHNGQWVNEVK